ncbi:Protein kintoun-like [Oopsacas minuta]|uniref:Protein kintoun n=1 Tax=Oopsacas minuta TaxID=111878 RepID=A0AAV7JCZ7_9METZ|nr:Protein kintoun-like [Oopsacas minuta]
MSEKEEFEITSDEAKKLGDALKKEEFRNLLVEYANEISDPENRKRYEEEITQLERERGYNVKFLNPTPGFVVKTRLKDGGMKIFINIATNPEIKTATPGPLEILPSGQAGKKWSIPYSLVPGREGPLDAKKQKCTIYDCIFNPETYKQAEDNPKFKEIMVTTALDGIENKFNVNLERKPLKYPKITYKGAPSTSVIRKSNEKAKEEFDKKVKSDPIQKLLSTKPIEPPKPPRDPTLPKHTLKYRGYFDMQDYTVDHLQTKGEPKEIVITIMLPKLDTIKDLELDIQNKKVILLHKDPKYSLEIQLSYQISGKDAKAKFIRDVRELELVLPIIHKPPITLPPREIPATIPCEDTPQEEPPVIDNEETNSVPLKLSENVMQSKYDSDDVMSDDTDESEFKVEPKTELPSDLMINKTLPPIEASEMKPTATELPPYEYRQTFKQFYFSFTAPDFRIDSISTFFRSNSAEVGFETNSCIYQIEIRFPTECSINASTSECRPSANGIVLKVDKLGGGNKMYDTFRICCGRGKFLEKNFLTENIILREIEQFGEPWSEENSSTPADIRVSKDDQQLVVELNMKTMANISHTNEAINTDAIEQEDIPPSSTDDVNIQGENILKDGPVTYNNESSCSKEKNRLTLSNDLIYELND